MTYSILLIVFLCNCCLSSSRAVLWASKWCIHTTVLTRPLLGRNCVSFFDEIPSEVWKTRQFDDILLRHCKAVYNQNTIDRWMKGCILPFPKKGDLRLIKNYQGITLTSIAAKIYNAVLQNRIEPKINNILRKNRNGFRRNRSTTSQILTIRRILEGIQAKNLQVTLLFVDFTKAFNSIHRGKMEQILLAYGIPKETVAAITFKHLTASKQMTDVDWIIGITSQYLEPFDHAQMNI